jgi:hypothetical protein
MFVQHDFQQPLPVHISAGSTTDESPDGGGANDSLEDAARDEREYVRERLRQELRREPTDEEVNEWLRQQTEGY